MTTQMHLEDIMRSELGQTEKDIPHIKQGNRVYFKESEFYEWLDKNRREDNHTTLADIEEMMASQATAYARKKK